MLILPNPSEFSYLIRTLRKRNHKIVLIVEDVNQNNDLADKVDLVLDWDDLMEFELYEEVEGIEEMRKYLVDKGWNFESLPKAVEPAELKTM